MKPIARIHLEPNSRLLRQASLGYVRQPPRPVSALAWMPFRGKEQAFEYRRAKIEKILATKFKRLHIRPQSVLRYNLQGCLRLDIILKLPGTTYIVITCVL